MQFKRNENKMHLQLCMKSLKKSRAKLFCTSYDNNGSVSIPHKLGEWMGRINQLLKIISI